MFPRVHFLARVVRGAATKHPKNRVEEKCMCDIMPPQPLTAALPESCCSCPSPSPSPSPGDVRPDDPAAAPPCGHAGRTRSTADCWGCGSGRGSVSAASELPGVSARPGDDARLDAQLDVALPPPSTLSPSPPRPHLLRPAPCLL